MKKIMTAMGLVMILILGVTYAYAARHVVEV